jgi:type I restriction enzyme M protein
MSPLVALYFAVEDHANQKDGVIWAIYHKNVRFVPYDSWTEIRALTAAEVYLGKRNFERLRNQRACLTVHPLPANADPFVPFEKQKHSHGLEKFIIPAASKYDLKKQLADLGTDRALMYPGLDGLAQHLKWKIERAVAEKEDLKGSSVTYRKYDKTRNRP